MLSKCFIGVALFVAIAAISLNAQSSIDYGVRGGLVISEIKLTNARNLFRGYNPLYLDQTTVSPMIGLFCRPFEFHSLDLELELVYTRKGATRTDEITFTTFDNPEAGGSGPMTTEFGLHYIILGLNIKPRYRIGSATIHGTLEPTASYLLSATNLIFIDNEPTRLVPGYQLGIGVDIPDLFRTPVSFDIKYAADFARFYQAGYGDFWNRSWILCVGLQL